MLQYRVYEHYMYVYRIYGGVFCVKLQPFANCSQSAFDRSVTAVTRRSSFHSISAPVRFVENVPTAAPPLTFNISPTHIVVHFLSVFVLFRPLQSGCEMKCAFAGALSG